MADIRSMHTILENYHDSTDRKTCKLSNLHDFSVPSPGNYHPLM